MTRGDWKLVPVKCRAGTRTFGWTIRCYENGEVVAVVSDAGNGQTPANRDTADRLAYVFEDHVRARAYLRARNYVMRPRR